MGYLGYFDNVTDVNATDPTRYLVYGFTMTVNQTAFPWYLFNATVQASTCSDRTNFDTYITLYDACPTDPDAEPLVLDKWLMAQALIPEASTLDRVRELMQHRDANR